MSTDADGEGIETEQLATQALHADDALDRQEGESDRELIQRRHGVDAAEYLGRLAEFRAAVREARHEALADTSEKTPSATVPDTTIEHLAERRADSDSDVNASVKERLAKYQADETTDEEEPTAPRERVASGGTTGGTPSDDDPPDAAEQLARNVLGAADVAELAGTDQSAAEYLRAEYSVDPAAFETERDLLRAKRQAEGTDHGGPAG